MATRSVPPASLQRTCEGWFLADVDGTGRIEIQKLDSADRFASDYAALLYVAARAVDGSHLHTRAIRAAAGTTPLSTVAREDLL